jgi:hypothetical protein
MPEDRRSELTLAALVRLLEHCGEGRWLLWARRHLERAQTDSIDPTVLDAYGGSGSFNDLTLDPVNGHALERMQVPWANRLLTVLGERIYQLAYERTDERFEAAWVHPPDPPVEGWRCLVCGHGEISDYDLEWWVARILVPAHVADSTLADGPDLIATMLSGQVIGAAESRADVMARASASTVHVVYRDDVMRPCTACGSGDTVVYRWIFAGGGLHPADDNPELRAPDYRYRPRTSPDVVASILDTHGCTHVTPELWELADKPLGDLLDAQTDAIDAVRGLEGSTYLTIDGDLERVAHRDGWKSAGEHTWLLPESAPTRVTLQAYLDEGSWQMYKAPSPAGAGDLPDLFNGYPASLSESLARLGIVALIDAWHDSTEWRVAVVLEGN